MHQPKHRRELNAYCAGYSKFHQTGFNRSYYAQQGTLDNYLTFESSADSSPDLVQTFARVIQYGSIGKEFESEEDLFAAGEYVVNVSCGERFSLFVTNLRRVFCCGDNTPGSCALPESVSAVKQVTLIPGLTNCNIVEVKCGKNHSFFISEGYEHVYTAGSNVHGESGLSIELESIFDVEKLISIEGKKLKLVAPGAFHSVFVTVDNCVYSSGYCAFGSLGQGHQSRSSKTPVRVDHPDLGGRAVIKSVECSQWHSIVITQHGSAYSWGYNFYGQCGLNHSSKDDVLSPTLVTGLPLGERVADARCGLYFTVFLAESNKLYICGENRSTLQSMVMAEIPLSIGTVLDFSCGETYVVITTEEGPIYVNGRTNYCGKGPREDSSQGGALIEVKLPDASHSVFRVACSPVGYHTLLYGVSKPRSNWSSKLFAAQQKGLLWDVTVLMDN